MTFRHFIIGQRVDKKMTVRNFSLSYGISPTTLVKIERGESVSARIRGKLIISLGFSYTDLCDKISDL